ncbi:hypothetical protein [Denitrobaculum tricleocarpae]|uniref:Exo-alpha-sialidase n=1 Tax=Denitrobaculum tricleocarpae TaxID=2591009 RepID=A0A545TRU8_9PROT|nr:hypothetical protein [Denitrobaculum tricleocarpae]TQV79861.1 hypothetical protein FKG95_14320 [Denitrobaculum tricleocarpae]
MPFVLPCATLSRFVKFSAILLMIAASTPLSTNAASQTSDWEADLPTRVWTPLHRMASDDAVTFALQKHSGSAFDTRRGRIFLFGSDTHGEDWSNAPLIFDLGLLSWQRLHNDDPPGSYRVNEAGLPVAGPDGDHPWAMHSFGAVDYHAAWDAVLVSSHPAHMEPGRFSTALAELWPAIERHPTWLFDLKEARWLPLPKAQTSFFAYAATYDSDRGIMIGTGHHGVFELTERDATWRKRTDGKAIGYHNNGVYDPDHKALIMFGRNGLGNDILVYRTNDAQLVAMPTPGLRPPKDEHTPMAFHPKLRETVVLVDRFAAGTSRQSRGQGRAETWAYDLAQDRWRRIVTADLPFALGMNYHLHYDPQRNLLLLVTSSPAPTPDLEPGLAEVWVLKL